MGKKISKEVDQAQAERDYIDHNLTELSCLNRTLLSAIKLIEEAQIPYALIGGVAVKELGRPRVTHDIDIFIRPDDANFVLEVLNNDHFDIEKRDPTWLYKAWKEDVLVDLIFKSSGDIYFDEEVRSHVRRIRYLGHWINAISPEDFIVIKAAAHEENNPHHWHDALAVITQGHIDWEYLIQRAKHSPRRVLAILIYAQSNDIAVPSATIKELFSIIYDYPQRFDHKHIHPYRREEDHQLTNKELFSLKSPLYLKKKLMDILSQNEMINEHDIQISIDEEGIILRGEVNNECQIKEIEETIKKSSPDFKIINYLKHRVLSPTQDSEIIR
jgi:predicted nucleotidyltransferase